MIMDIEAETAITAAIVAIIIEAVAVLLGVAVMLWVAGGAA